MLLFLKRYEIGPWLLWNVNMNTFDPDFKVTTFLKSNISTMVYFSDKVTIEH